MAALAALVAAQEAPALLAALGDALRDEEKGLPELVKRAEDAAAALVEQERIAAELREALAAAPDSAQYRREHFAAGGALAEGEKALRTAMAAAGFSANMAERKRRDCAEIEARIAAVKSLPKPDPEILALLGVKR